MGCKQSKYAVGDEGQDEYGRDQYKGDPSDMDNDRLYSSDRGIATDIIPAHRYMEGGGNYSCEQGSGSNRALAPMPPRQPAPNTGMCSDAVFTQMAEGCTSGFLDMFSLSNSRKRITNAPVEHLNAYQQPAYNYQSPPSSESFGNHSRQSQHSQNSQQRRAVIVRNGSFTL